jgi:ParB family chromosome partitioning protein
VEEAEALDRLRQSRDCTQKELARIMGKTPASISQTLSLTRLPQAVRDECRKDPSVPKRVLIEIAAKKQARSMVKAYEAYKAGLNPEKKEKTGEAATPVQMAIKAIGATLRRVEALDPRKLSPEELKSLIAAMTEFKEFVVEGLAALKELSSREEPGGTEQPRKKGTPKKGTLKIPSPGPARMQRSKKAVRRTGDNRKSSPKSKR